MCAHTRVGFMYQFRNFLAKLKLSNWQLNSTLYLKLRIVSVIARHTFAYIPTYSFGIKPYPKLQIKVIVRKLFTLIESAPEQLGRLVRILLPGKFWAVEDRETVVAEAVRADPVRGVGNAVDLEINKVNRFNLCFSLCFMFFQNWKNVTVRAWARGVVDRAPVCHLGDPSSNLGQANFLQWLMALTRPTQYSIPCTGVKTGWGDS
jgi:hypothetical protein